MTSGLILLTLLAVLAAFGWARMRRRLGMSVTGRSFLATAVVVALALLALWAYSTHR